MQHPRLRRIFDRENSAALFELLTEPQTDFRQRLIRMALRHGFQRESDARGRIYLNVGHTGLNDAGFRAWVRQADIRPVYFVHDLIPITHPEFCRAGESEKHRERMRTVLGTATGIIGNSQATLRELGAFAEAESLPYPDAIAAPLGSDALATPCDENSQPEQPTFVILGTIEARKNHLLLLHIWSRLVSRLGSQAPKLLIIGQRGWECEQVLDLLDRSETLKGSVVEIGRCDDLTLARHLSNARALLFPSLIEGYGLPLVEALRAGLPAIASDLPVFREIAGNIPDYLDPLDGPGWERAVLSYADENSLDRKAQFRRLASYSPPTWHDHFSAVTSWLSTL